MIRVWELAQRLGVPANKLVSELRNLDINVSSAVSILEDDVAEEILELFAPEKKRKLEIKENSTIRNVAEILRIKPSNLIKTLLKEGIPVSINQRISQNIADMINKLYNVELNIISERTELLNKIITKDKSYLIPAAPVITVMGHIDHGKTTLLDAIRASAVASSEKGGITQHIGAYKVTHSGRDIVFLDTPGHEAFTSLRLRGAEVTDIVVLVVAADDGVMPQTKEAISHARVAGVPIVVAINKIDLPTANPLKTKKQLAEEAKLIPEEWGGDTLFVEISAKTKQGIDELLDLLLILAETLQLKTNPNAYAQGFVLESKLTREFGYVATIILKWGTLKVGDNFICGTQLGKVRALYDHNKKSIKEATAVTPVEVIGFSRQVEASDKFYAVAPEDLDKLQKFNDILKKDEKKRVTLPSFHERFLKQQKKELKLILKVDTQGSEEAITNILHKLSSDKVKIKIIHSGVGNVTYSDVLLAAAANAIILSFFVKEEPNVRAAAEKEGVEIRSYDVIYKLEEDIAALAQNLLPKKVEFIPVGLAEIKKLFNIPKVGLIAGAYVKSGKVILNSKVRVIKNNKITYEGKIVSLKRFKEDVKEVQAGYECGIKIEGIKDIEEGDKIEVLEEKLVKNNF